MTAIAYRDGVLAADSVGWAAEGHVKTPVSPKIVRHDGVGMFACCGGETEIALATEWMTRSGTPKPTLDHQEGFGCIWVRPNGSVWYINWRLHPVPRPEGFMAIGASDKFMLGAMFAGASAEEAVRLAILHTDGAGGAVQVERLGQLAT
jgi:hypothetical protein